MLLSCFNLHAHHITTPNLIMGTALAYGGLGQTIVGHEEWAGGNTFGATVFASYGGFWLSFSTLYNCSSGSLACRPLLVRLVRVC